MNAPTYFSARTWSLMWSTSWADLKILQWEASESHHSWMPNHLRRLLFDTPKFLPDVQALHPIAKTGHHTGGNSFYSPNYIHSVACGRQSVPVGGRNPLVSVPRPHNTEAPYTKIGGIRSKALYRSTKHL